MATVFKGAGLAALGLIARVGNRREVLNLSGGRGAELSFGREEEGSLDDEIRDSEQVPQERLNQEKALWMHRPGIFGARLSRIHREVQGSYTSLKRDHPFQLDGVSYGAGEQKEEQPPRPL